MHGRCEPPTRAFEKVLDKASAEKRQLDAWESECLRAALLMVAMNDQAAAQQAIQRCAHAPPGINVNLQPTFSIEDMRVCLVVLQCSNLELGV